MKIQSLSTEPQANGKSCEVPPQQNSVASFSLNNRSEWKSDFNLNKETHAVTLLHFWSL